MNNFKNRLKEAMENKHISQAELSRRTHIGRNSISDYLKGKYEAKQDKVYLLAKELNVSEAWLMGYDVLSKKEQNNIDDISSIYKELNTKNKTDVYNYAQRKLDEQNGKSITVGRVTAAGNPLCGETQDSEEQHLIVNRDEIPRGADEVITIAGDSMEPLLPKGSQQFIHYQPTPDTDGQVMIVRIKDEGVTCKKVYREKNKIRLVSVNDKYGDMVYPTEDVECIGKVIL